MHTCFKGHGYIQEFLVRDISWDFQHCGSHQMYRLWCWWVRISWGHRGAQVMILFSVYKIGKQGNQGNPTTLTPIKMRCKTWIKTECSGLQILLHVYSVKYNAKTRYLLFKLINLLFSINIHLMLSTCSKMLERKGLAKFQTLLV